MTSFWDILPVVEIHRTLLMQELCTPFGGQVLEGVAAAWQNRQRNSIWKDF
jgi:hypothetical protein